MRVALLGDVHCRMKRVREAIEINKPVLQLGDFGDYQTWSEVQHMSQDDLMVVGGNHDNYEMYYDSPVALGDFGLVPGCKSTFFIRGALSIDPERRMFGRDWWPNEELSIMQMEKMLDEYERIKPEVVVSHDGPVSATQKMFGVYMESRTSGYLDLAYQIYQPKQWFFGHHHTSKKVKLGRTKFRCLTIDELVIEDLP